MISSFTVEVLVTTTVEREIARNSLRCGLMVVRKVSTGAEVEGSNLVGC